MEKLALIDMNVNSISEILMAIPIPAIIFDYNSRKILAINKYCLNLCSLSRKELIGKNSADIFFNYTDTECCNRYADVPQNKEIKILKNHEKYSIVRTFESEFIYKKKRVILQIFIDITEQLEVQKKIERNIKVQYALKKINEAASKMENIREFYKALRSIIHEHYSPVGLSIQLIERNKDTKPIVVNRNDIYLKHKQDFERIHNQAISYEVKQPIQKNQNFEENVYKIEEENEEVLNILGVPLKNKNGQVMGCFCCFFYKDDYVYDKEDNEYLAFAATTISMCLGRLNTEKELKKSYHKLLRTQESIIHILANALEVKDPYTAGHQKRVCQLAYEIAKKVKPSDKEFLQRIKLAATIHDIGKIYVPSELLTRPGIIKDVEKQFINLHAEVGYNLLSKEQSLADIAEIVYQHHERIDGSGYPQGLLVIRFVWRLKS
ncbi:HD domain-containing protein [Aminipila terrae]|uniref:HD domain-containing protein n=1 Tax=Aminipila terrae TaxID=2697030 RepID=A0A6P1MC72_9FIRM|nr:HD domain-containing phosphohydrolase [Aminipila terrae]QHI71622.1 HD domain-containing protein [Aminipila terrae]